MLRKHGNIRETSLYDDVFDILIDKLRDYSDGWDDATVKAIDTLIDSDHIDKIASKIVETVDAHAEYVLDKIMSDVAGKIANW